MSLGSAVAPQRVPSPVPLSGPEVKFRWMESLWVQVTGTLCNIACRHCFISCGPKADDVPLMTVGQIEKALEEGRTLGMRHIYYTGGEPFLHPQLRLLVDRALEIAPLTIITNGLLLDDVTVQWIAEVFHRSRYSFDLRVSLDGTTAAQNDPVRGRGTFTQIASAIQRLSRAGLSPVVTVVEHEQGLAAAEARTRFVEFLKGLGVRQPRLKFLPLLRIGREERRTHGYEGESPLSSDALQPEIEATLLCATGRVATAQGIFTCPILIKYPSARLGSNLADAARPIHLNWHACQTCVFDGLRCNT
jgi:molybdenum cofactor biosynthesis enzyme MoaA